MNDLRVTAYVDGFNLYYGLRSKGWGHFYWIDPVALARTLVRTEYALKRVRYFTARVKKPDDKRKRQNAYLDALKTASSAEIILGRFYPERDVEPGVFAPVGRLRREDDG